jgi:hypothetical protein
VFWLFVQLRRRISFHPVLHSGVFWSLVQLRRGFPLTLSYHTLLCSDPLYTMYIWGGFNPVLHSGEFCPFVKLRRGFPLTLAYTVVWSDPLVPLRRGGSCLHSGVFWPSCTAEERLFFLTQWCVLITLCKAEKRLFFLTQWCVLTLCKAEERLFFLTQWCVLTLLHRWAEAVL